MLEFRCAELRGCVTEKTMPKPLTAFETMPLDLDIDPELKGTRPCGKAGFSILERLADIQSLTVQIQEKAFFAAMFTDDRLDIGKPPQRLPPAPPARAHRAFEPPPAAQFKGRKTSLGIARSPIPLES